MIHLPISLLILTRKASFKYPCPQLGIYLNCRNVLEQKCNQQLSHFSHFPKLRFVLCGER